VLPHDRPDQARWQLLLLPLLLLPLLLLRLLLLPLLLPLLPPSRSLLQAMLLLLLLLLLLHAAARCAMVINGEEAAPVARQRGHRRLRRLLEHGLLQQHQRALLLLLLLLVHSARIAGPCRWHRCRAQLLHQLVRHRALRHAHKVQQQRRSHLGPARRRRRRDTVASVRVALGSHCHALLVLVLLLLLLLLLLRIARLWCDAERRTRCRELLHATASWHLPPLRPLLLLLRLLPLLLLLLLADEGGVDAVHQLLQALEQLRHVACCCTHVCGALIHLWAACARVARMRSVGMSSPPHTGEANTTHSGSGSAFDTARARCTPTLQRSAMGACAATSRSLSLRKRSTMLSHSACAPVAGHGVCVLMRAGVRVVRASVSCACRETRWRGATRDSPTAWHC
jgi:hypothetical protein